MNHNGHAIGHVYGDDSNTYDIASTLELVHVVKGDQVWAANGGENSVFRGSGVARFAGFLLHADLRDGKHVRPCKASRRCSNRDQTCSIIIPCTSAHFKEL